MKNVWIWNHYATAMFFDKGGRHYSFSKYLIRSGYSPTVFCANTFHNRSGNVEIKKGIYKEDNVDSIPFVFIKTSSYKGNGFSRLRNMLLFSINLFRSAKRYAKYKAPDIIIASSVHPLTCVAGIIASWRFRTPCIVEIRDLWPESVFEYSDLSKTSLIGRLLQVGEKWIYKNADRIVFTKPGDYGYICEQGWQVIAGTEKCRYINNGVDLEEFDYNKNHYSILDGDLDNTNTFKLVYVGSIRSVNGLGIIARVARELKESTSIKILVWGTGNELEELHDFIRSENLDNIVFKGYIHKRFIPYILSKADINISHFKFTKLLRFGTSQNKDFEYLASGKPILRTMNSNYDLIIETNAGKTVVEQTTQSIKNSIEDFYRVFVEERTLYNMMCENARAASLNYDYRLLTHKLIAIIEELI